MNAMSVPVAYVNLYGAPVSVVGRPSAKERAVPGGEKRHMGFLAVGVPPEDVDRARKVAESREKEFDLGAFLISAKKRRITRKPFQIRSAALKAAEMGANVGWLHCDVVEVIR